MYHQKVSALAFCPEQISGITTVIKYFMVRFGLLSNSSQYVKAELEEDNLHFMVQAFLLPIHFVIVYDMLVLVDVPEP